MCKNLFKKVITLMMICSIMVMMFEDQTYAQVDQSIDTQPIQISLLDHTSYSTFMTQTTYDLYDGEDISITAVSAFDETSSTGNIATYAKEESVVATEGQSIEFIVDVPQPNLYEIHIEYAILNDNLLPTQTRVRVNDDTPFKVLDLIIFENDWETPEDVALDRYGNEIAPIPTKVEGWKNKALVDGSYRYTTPLLIPLDAGENTLNFEIMQGDIAIKNITITAPQVIQEYEPNEVVGDIIHVIEGQSMSIRNDSSVRAGSEFNVALSPNDPSKRVLNMLDGNAFKRAGQTVTYEFEIEESGYYMLAFNYKQSDRTDYPVFVDIFVNGELQNDQLKNYPMPYTTKFNTMTVTDLNQGEPMAIYFEEGLQTLQLQLSIEPLVSAIEKIEQIIKEMNELALEINKLTGGKTDKYRDFDLEEYIPGIEESLIDWATRIAIIHNEIENISDTVESMAAFSTLKMAESNLLRLAEKPNELPARMTEFSTGTTSALRYLANVLEVVDSSELSIDRIYIYQDDSLLPKKPSIFVRMWDGIKRFFYSFTTQDYSVNAADEENLQVWINRPRQYVEILQKMIDEDFTPKTGIKVDLSLMPDQNKLILSNAAGNAPDVAQSVLFTLPHDLAIRGALEDLSTYDGYDEVISYYPEGILVPAMIGDSVYAIPETMNFWVMFYRTDIFNSLNVPIPNTMQEVVDILPELQRRGMGFYYPSAGMPGMKAFAATVPLIYQHGGTLYGEQVGETQINSELSINGLRELTELFLIYNAPYDVPSFYQNFRDGTTPIGIAEYGMYNLLLNAAPEIANDWEIALFPGVEIDGEVQRWSMGAAESSVIFKSSDKKDEAWEYLKWWSSVETQVEFGYTLQTTYGKEFLWNTANIEAFNRLPWQTDHKAVIAEQTEWMIEPPRVPGTYMLERELSNVLNAVVLDGKTLRNAVDDAVKRIDRETVRKLEEFGYMENGEIVTPYPTPRIEMEGSK